MVVDDEVDLQALISAKFRKLILQGEFIFCFALNGAEALKQLENDSEINIILTDIRMPVMDGLTLMSNLSELKKNYKVIVISAYGDMSNIREAMNRGASDFVTKPIDFDDLTITLRKIIAEYNKLLVALEGEKHYEEVRLELAIAKNIQERMLPRNFHPFKNQTLEMDARMIPAQLVGGDFFDFFPLGDHKIGLVVADVSGKGLPACLYMAITHSLFRAFSRQGLSCPEVLTQLNNYLGTDNDSCVFVTAFYAVLDISNGSLVYCNAGHNAPYILQKSGLIKKLVSNPGHVLGLSETFSQLPEFKESSLVLEDKDCLFLYTDGVTEAWNTNQELFSEKRLEKFLENAQEQSITQLIDCISNEVSSFAEGNTQSDDITIFAIRYHANSVF